MSPISRLSGNALRSIGALPSRFLSKRLVLAIHRDLIDSFGGTHGVRDEGLLESAPAQRQMTAGRRLVHGTVFEQAAAYLFHLCGNHPFVDGNKRVAFAATDTFLRLNRYRLTLTDDVAYELTTDVAQKRVGKREIASLLRRSSEST